jgi:hypothetical protein
MPGRALFSDDEDEDIWMLASAKGRFHESFFHHNEADEEWLKLCELGDGPNRLHRKL